MQDFFFIFFFITHQCMSKQPVRELPIQPKEPQLPCMYDLDESVDVTLTCTCRSSA